jgi:hypothetical protein
MCHDEVAKVRPLKKCSVTAGGIPPAQLSILLEAASKARHGANARFFGHHGIRESLRAVAATTKIRRSLLGGGGRQAAGESGRKRRCQPRPSVSGLYNNT